MNEDQLHEAIKRMARRMVDQMIPEILEDAPRERRHLTFGGEKLIIPTAVRLSTTRAGDASADLHDMPHTAGLLLDGLEGGIGRMLDEIAAEIYRAEPSPSRLLAAWFVQTWLDGTRAIGEQCNNLYSGMSQAWDHIQPTPTDSFAEHFLNKEAPDTE